MNKIKIINQVAFFFLFVLSFSCSNNEPSKKCTSSFEVSPTKDTVNRIDCGLKQGKWIPRPSNKLTDTVYYHNDTLVEG